MASTSQYTNDVSKGGAAIEQPRKYISDQDIDVHVVGLVHRCRATYRLHEGYEAKNACSRLKLNLIFRRNAGNFDGSLDYDSRTILINQRRGHRGPRLQFTIFHEITHFLLEEDGELIERLHDTYGEDEAEVKRAKELACDIGASEFLAPQHRVRAKIDREGLHIGLVEKLYSTFGLSHSASCMQLARCAPVSCYICVCKHATSRRMPKLGKHLHIEVAAKSYTAGTTLEIGTPIPTDHVFCHAWRGHGIWAAESYVPYQDRPPRLCYVEAKRIKTRLYGLMHWEESPGRSQAHGDTCSLLQG